METISHALLTFVLNSLWQVPLATGAAALACWLLRKSPASHRHVIWVAALVAAILLPLISIHHARAMDRPQLFPSLVTQDGRNPKPPAEAAAPSPIGLLRKPPARTISFPARTATLLLWAYVPFVLVRFARLVRAWLRTVQLRRAAQIREIPLELGRVRSRCEAVFGAGAVELLLSAKLSGPVTAGSAILLPESLWTESSEDILVAAIGHEMAHVVRRDFACNLLYELLQLPISFHPAAWFIRREIERTREMACDEMVTHRLLDAGAYARSIVNIAAAMTALPHPGYTLGVFDGDILEERIRRVLSRPAANVRRARLLLAGSLAVLTFCVALTSSLSFSARAQRASIQRGPTLRFEVASIKPCAPGEQPEPRPLFGGTPGRVSLSCMTVLGLINQSYVLYANGRLALPGGRFVPIEKGPAWINSDRYTIEAKPEGTPSQGTMLGPMMQALLEERFKLKIHSETREVPVYNLVVTKGGPRLTMSRPGSCLSFDIEHPLPPPKPGQSLPPICGMARIANMGFEMYGATMPELGVQLSRGLGRDIIDKTGIAGTYDIQVALEPGAAGVFSPPPPPPPPPGGGGSQQPAPDNQPDTTDSFLVAQAIAQKLGLRLDSAKGPGPVLFIDHVEKPSEN